MMQRQRSRKEVAEDEDEAVAQEKEEKDEKEEKEEKEDDPEAVAEVELTPAYQWRLWWHAKDTTDAGRLCMRPMRVAHNTAQYEAAMAAGGSESAVLVRGMGNMALQEVRSVATMLARSWLDRSVAQSFVPFNDTTTHYSPAEVAPPLPAVTYLPCRPLVYGLHISHLQIVSV